MAFKHAKNTVIILNAKDLSAFCNTSTLTRNADSHDTTTYGKDDHVFEGGLGNGTASIGGIYDTSAANGPRGVIEPIVGTVKSLTRRPEGTGAGLPQQVVNVLIVDYVETNPVADMISWTASLQLSDAIDDTVQA